MLIGSIETGYNPIRNYSVGTALGDVLVVGGSTTIWQTGNVPPRMPFAGVLHAPALGGFGPNTQGSNEYLANQLEEFVNSPNNFPVYIQWSAARTLPQDGWYFIQDWATDYSTTYAAIKFSGTALRAGTTDPPPVGVFLQGGAVASTYSVAGSPLVGLPHGIAAGSSRGGAGGSHRFIKPTFSGHSSFFAFTPPASASDWYAGRVRVYDTITPGGGTNFTQMPTTGDYAGADWVEVFSGSHGYSGDVVFTNGLIALVFAPKANANGATQLAELWAWDASGAKWAKFGTLTAPNMTPIGVTADRFGHNEIRLILPITGAAGQGQLRFRMQRSQRFARIEARTRYTAGNDFLQIDNTVDTGTATASNAAHSLAWAGSPGAVAADTARGYGDLFVSTGAFHAGFLYHKPPSTGQPYLASNSGIQLADAASLNNAMASYGVYMTTDGATGDDTAAAIWEHFQFDQQVSMPVFI